MSQLLSSAQFVVQCTSRAAHPVDGTEPNPRQSELGNPWSSATSRPERLSLRTALSCTTSTQSSAARATNPSYPFWHRTANGGLLWDYTPDQLVGSYLHTFFRDHPTLGIVGAPRVLTFRSFEYQAVALTRVFAGRDALPLPSTSEQARWVSER
jgi:hypothetical protein